MAKKYTAQEMRQRANAEEHLWHDRLTAEMLRQAADIMEREKKYEYVARYISRINGEICENFGNRYDTKEEVMENALRSCCVQTTIMRRAVGEWEEVNEKM